MASKETNHYICIFGGISFAGLSLFALTKLAQNWFRKNKKIRVPDEYKPINFSEEELTVENFENVLKKHTIRFNHTSVMEEILPRFFENEEQLSKISENFIYAQGHQDLISLSKVIKND